MSANTHSSRIDLALTLSAFSIVLNILTLFVILLWWNLSGSPPKWDSVSVSLTVLEIFIAVGAVASFTIFRSSVRAKAEEVALEAAERISESEAAERAEIVALRVAEKAVSERLGVTEQATQDLADAMGDDEDEG
ncbi:MAG: hypothetical protein KI788_15605 [Mameliella sp.]|nr:hypothetical protein [Mameliella sp.]